MITKNFIYFTATVLNWKQILKPDKYKDVLINSFKYLVDKEKVRIFDFVIMPNHFLSVWKINENLEKSDFQRDFMKYTAQKILNDLKRNKLKYIIPYMLEQSATADRNHQIWERIFFLHLYIPVKKSNRK